jgi:hypothetical protein
MLVCFAANMLISLVNYGKLWLVAEFVGVLLPYKELFKFNMIHELAMLGKPLVGGFCACFFDTSQFSN